MKGSSWMFLRERAHNRRPSRQVCTSLAPTSRPKMNWHPASGMLPGAHVYLNAACLNSRVIVGATSSNGPMVQIQNFDRAVGLVQHVSQHRWEECQRKLCSCRKFSRISSLEVVSLEPGHSASRMPVSSTSSFQEITLLLKDAPAMSGRNYLPKPKDSAEFFCNPRPAVELFRRSASARIQGACSSSSAKRSCAATRPVVT